MKPHAAVFLASSLMMTLFSLKVTSTEASFWLIVIAGVFLFFGLLGITTNERGQ